MTIPADLRVPFLYVEFDSTRAFTGPSVLRYKVLMVGQRLAGGTRAELITDRVTSAAQAAGFYGEGSQLALMFAKWFQGNKQTEVYGCALDDDAAGVQATGTFAITGPASAAGSVVFYIGGVRIPIAVADTDTATDIGDALVAAITTALPVTAVNATGTVTLTARNDGEPGNDIDLRVNYNPGEEMPTGVAVVVTPMASGANNPDLADVIAAIGDEWYNLIIAPFNDATNLTTIETELTSRFGPLRQIDGMYLTTKTGTVGQLATFGNSRNNPHVSCPHSQKVPCMGFQFAAAYGAQVAAEGAADPARPLQTLELVGILPPVVEDRFTLSENNSLLYDGISTFYVDTGGKVRIQRAITMYQTNVVGAPDIAYLDVETLLTLMFLRYDFRTQILTRYPRAKLADDGVQVGPGQVVMTPKLGKSEAVNIFRGWETLGLVENVEQFKSEMSCVRSITDPNRLDWILPPDLINQFRVGSAVIQFLLD